MDRLHDWRSTVFGARALNPEVPARARTIPKRGPFRTDAVTTIRAYHYRRAYTNAGYAEAGDDLFDPPFTSDGRLDGHVVPPEALLTDEERDRVLGLIRAAATAEMRRVKEGTKRPVLHCMFDPHHVFVLFDAAQVPIAKIIVCFTCGEIRALPSVPALGGDGTAVLTSNEAETLKDIIDRHGLGAWTYAEGPELGPLFEYGEEDVWRAPDTHRARTRTALACERSTFQPTLHPSSPRPRTAGGSASGCGPRCPAGAASKSRG